MDILSCKLKKDLHKKLKEYMVMMEFTDIDNELEDMIDCINTDNLFSFTTTDYEECKCHARLWGREGRGSQCTHNRVEESKYCKKHNDMIRYYGVLRFGDITDKKPKYDKIKLTMGTKERLHWIQQDPLLRLQQVLDKHQVKLITSIPHLIVR